MSIVIANRQRTRRIHTKVLKQIASALLAELGLQQAELGINLVTAAEMAEVNWRFLQHAGSTDVITFDHRGPGGAPDQPEWQLHGELFICVDDAVTQAGTCHTTWTSEVARYVVHGVLHLLGYEDRELHERRRMKREENRLVQWLEGRFSLAELSHGVKIKT
jgi:probable rRNA maturation factor